MQKVVLKFTSAALLWAFKQAIGAPEVDINLDQCTITCECSETEITLATTIYRAKIVGEVGKAIK